MYSKCKYNILFTYAKHFMIIIFFSVFPFSSFAFSVFSFIHPFFISVSFPCFLCVPVFFTLLTGFTFEAMNDKQAKKEVLRFI